MRDGHVSFTFPFPFHNVPWPGVCSPERHTWFLGGRGPCRGAFTWGFCGTRFFPSRERITETARTCVGRGWGEPRRGVCAASAGALGGTQPSAWRREYGLWGCVWRVAPQGPQQGAGSPCAGGRGGFQATLGRERGGLCKIKYFYSLVFIKWKKREAHGVLIL